MDTHAPARLAADPPPPRTHPQPPLRLHRQPTPNLARTSARLGSQRLAVQAQARSWANGAISVEDRLIAAKPEIAEPELPEGKPVINKNTEKILARRGPIQPLEQRLQQSVRHVRSSGVGSEVRLSTAASSRELSPTACRLPAPRRCVLA